jgi:hypothetical protein
MAAAMKSVGEHSLQLFHLAGPALTSGRLPVLLSGSGLSRITGD